jgi:hypothetical protein
VRLLRSKRSLAAAILVLVVAPVTAQAFSSSPDLQDPRPAPAVAAAEVTGSGISWGPNVKVNNDVTGSVQRHPGVAIDGKGTVYATWAEIVGTVRDVYISRSTDWGQTWERRGRVNDIAGQGAGMRQAHPYITLAPNGDLFVMFFETGPPIKLAIVKSTDGGASFSPPLFTAGSEMMQLAVDSRGGLHVVWINYTQGQGARVAYVNSKDGGATFSAKKWIDSVGSESCQCCKIQPLIGPNDEIYVVWRAGSKTNQRDIWFTKSTDGGATFTAPVKVSDWTWNTSTCPWSGPEISMDSQGRLHVLATDVRSGPGNGDLYHYASADAGATWSAATRVNPASPEMQDQAALAYVGGKLLAVYTDSNMRLYWTTSVDGSSWSAPVRVAPSNTKENTYPWVAYTDRAAVFVWNDNRSGAWDAYSALYFGDDGVPPSVSITSPQDGATLGGLVTVAAAASDDFVVSKVEFLLDGVRQAEDASAPYSWTWDTSTSPDGGKKLSAVATDLAGNSATHEIAVTIANQGGDATPPSVAFTSPGNGQTVNGVLTLAADASDNRGVAEVEFLVDGAPLSKDASGPYTATWDTGGAAPGAHLLRATAVDTSGNSADADITVTVDQGAQDTVAPVVSISDPSGGAKVSGNIPIKATATDNIGVVGATLAVDGSDISTLSAPPFDWSLDSLKYVNGDHSLEVRARDAAGNEGKASVSVTIENSVQDLPPTVTIVQPADGASVSGTVLVKADGRDDRALDHLEFRLDGRAMKRVTTGAQEWSFDTTSAADGAHSIEVEAVDEAGQSAEAGVSVNVANGGTESSPLGGSIGLVLGVAAVAAVAAVAGAAALVIRGRRGRQNTL